MFKKWFADRRLERIRTGNIPGHIALIMDGNGRWARKRALPRVAGHRAGMEAIRRCIAAAGDLGVSYLTLYAFSTENWRRPKSEVDFLMELPGQFIGRELSTLMDNNIRLNIIGNSEDLPAHTRKSIQTGVEKTIDNTGMVLSFAMNYGGRNEIIQAVQRVCELAREGAIVNQELFVQCLYTAELPDPDLVIRTSGEIRISNFLLWQIAYAELYFVETLWPDFSKDNLYAAVEHYQRRKRRYGGLGG